MPLIFPQEGVYDDIKLALQAYDWQEEFRIITGSGSRSITPGIFIHYELAGRPVPDNSIVIQPNIVRGIEAGGPRARVSCTCNCFSKSAEVAFKLTEAVWNVLFATEDSHSTKWFSSTDFTTAKKFPPVSTTTFGLQKSKDGFWMGIIYVEAETQQSNTN